MTAGVAPPAMPASDSAWALGLTAGALAVVMPIGPLAVACRARHPAVQHDRLQRCHGLPRSPPTRAWSRPC